MVADTGAEGAPVRREEFGAKAVDDHTAGQCASCGYLLVGDRQDGDLDRGHPCRECAGVDFGEVGDEAFEAAEDAAVHHDRSLWTLVGCDVAQIELGRLVEVELDGGQGSIPARPGR